MSQSLVTCSRNSYLPGEAQPFHSHPVTSVSVIIRGSPKEMARAGARTREAIGSTLSVVVKRAGVEHANQYGDLGAELIQLSFDAGASLRLFDDREGGGRVPDWKWGSEPGATRALLRLSLASEEVRLIAADSPEVVDTIAALTPWRSPPRTGSPPVWLERVRSQLDAELSSRPRVDELASGAGVHPVHLARCYRHWYGRSISGHLALARIGRAVELLANPAIPLSVVALRAGFADQAHLCRNFRHHVNVTPNEYRRLLR
jgi:AraC-like DNA-binding protein